MRTLFLSLLMTNVLIACSGEQKQENSQIREITYNTSEQSSKHFDLTPLIDTTTFEIIPLESHSDAIVGTISDVYVRGNKIIVVDNNSNYAYAFNRQGKFLNKLGSIGEGPKDYHPNFINAILVEEDRIGFFNFYTQKISYYDFDNKFIKTYDNFPVPALNIYPIDGQYVCMSEFVKNEIGCNHMYIINKNETKPYFPFEDKPINRGWGVDKQGVIANNKLYFHLISKDTIFQYDKKTGVKPIYNIKLKGRTVPDEIKNGNGREALMYKIKNNAVLGMQSIDVLNNILFINFGNNHIVYDMATNKQIGLFDRCGIKDWDDFSYLSANTPHGYFRDGYFIFHSSADEWCTYKEYKSTTFSAYKNDFHKQLWEKTQQMTEEDNPILILVKVQTKS